MTEFDELARLWKKAIEDHFKLISQHSNTKTCWDEIKSLEYDTGMLTTPSPRMRRAVSITLQKLELQQATHWIRRRSAGRLYEFIFVCFIFVVINGLRKLGLPGTTVPCD